ncbi:Predicted N-acyltransferase, GNAT family [Pustulibacterium marinum]|uniref:Predicted N-acyltransferase, GNAT family n=1 Tax=Pustulibacterium marinum TaxID=1224947 RepID=A0A1I7FVE9_9FLAO|nr:GNAT family N-acetyltransferase [Pustulibacterium marinum]SFU40169.1 Predicted N-acyltransferase, GNAT family [Pustulibacterium marinum]
MSVIKFITPQEVITVRHPILREGKPLESCIFLGDHSAGTFHLGYYENNQLVGVVTLFKKNYGENGGIGYQLRGMAVLQEFQGKQIGRKLVEKAEQIAIQRYGNYVWMNARIVAVGFYEKMGYHKVSNAFDVPGIGNHFTMLKKLQN